MGDRGEFRQDLGARSGIVLNIALTGWQASGGG